MITEASARPRPDPPYGGDQRRQPAGLGKRVDEGLGIGAVGIDLAMVFVGELGAEVAQRIAHFLEAVGSLVDHRGVSRRARRRVSSRGPAIVTGLAASMRPRGESSRRPAPRTITEFDTDPSESPKPRPEPL